MFLLVRVMERAQSLSLIRNFWLSMHFFMRGGKVVQGSSGTHKCGL